MKKDNWEHLRCLLYYGFPRRCHRCCRRLHFPSSPPLPPPNLPPPLPSPPPPPPSLAHLPPSFLPSFLLNDSRVCLMTRLDPWPPRLLSTPLPSPSPPPSSSSSSFSSFQSYLLYLISAPARATSSLVSHPSAMCSPIDIYFGRSSITVRPWVKWRP